MAWHPLCAKLFERQRQSTMPKMPSTAGLAKPDSAAYGVTRGHHAARYPGILDRTT
jgi:hypothetical protein